MRQTRHKSSTSGWLPDWDNITFDTITTQNVTGCLTRYRDVELQRATVWLADWHVSMTYTYRNDRLTKKFVLSTKKLISEGLNDWLTETISRVGDITNNRATNWLALSYSIKCLRQNTSTNDWMTRWLTDVEYSNNMINVHVW